MVAEVGRVGRYTLHGRIGSGGLATVHLGHADGAHGFRRLVAIKRLRDELASDPEVRAMLVDESRLLARIQHHAVVSVLDVVVAGSELWLVTEYVHGESLARLLDVCVQRGTPPPAALAVTIVVEALHGLEAAHRCRSEAGEPLGLVHRDVSPQNILVSETGSVKVADFGVARATGRLQVTREGQLKGKLAYMAPEQVLGGEVDARADVFSAAVVLWEALTLRRLFGGASDLATMERVLRAPIDPPSRVEPRAPAALDEVVLKGLAKRPDDRWPSARAFAEALDAAIVRPKTGAIGDWVRELASDALDEKSRIRLAMAGDPEPATRAFRRPPARERSSSARGYVVIASAAAVLGLLGHLVLRAPPSAGARDVPGPIEPARAAEPLAAPPERVSATAPIPSSPQASSTAAAATTAAAARGRGPVPTPARPAPACDPPYVIDERGIVRPKRECL